MPNDLQGRTGNISSVKVPITNYLLNERVGQSTTLAHSVPEVNLRTSHMHLPSHSHFFGCYKFPLSSWTLGTNSLKGYICITKGNLINVENIFRSYICNQIIKTFCVFCVFFFFFFQYNRWTLQWREVKSNWSEDLVGVYRYILLAFIGPRQTLTRKGPQALPGLSQTGQWIPHVLRDWYYK